VEREDEVLLLLREAAALQVGAEVVDPPQAAALAAALQPCTHQNAIQPKAPIEQWS
jgi:hypothetical protein